MTYAELGEALRTEREKRHLSIDDAANELKINVRQLQALEEGNVDLLPHPAYIKGFIRSYASWLGISHDEIQRALASLGISEKSQPKIVQNEDGKVSSSKKKSFASPIFILLLALALYIGWQNGVLDYFQKFNISNFSHSPTLQSAEEFISSKTETNNKLKTENQIVPKENEKKANMEDNEKPIILQEKPVEIKEHTNPEPLPTNSSNKKISENEVSEDESSRNLSASSTVPGQNKLVITATEECWIHSNADKTDTRQFSLRKGDTFALTFAKSLELKLGNAGGVRLRYNGKDLSTPGTSGQVKVLNFPPETES